MRRPLIITIVLLIITGTAVGALVFQQGDSVEQPMTASSSSGRVEDPSSGYGSDDGGVADASGDPDGVIPEGSPLSPESNAPAVAKLDPALRSALRRAAVVAHEQGIEVLVTSGWRSSEYQQQLLDDAIAERGADEARRWVQTPEVSRHVSGRAVDVGRTDATYWMLEHGVDYGLCQVYANEVWHYELLTSPGGTCPTPLTDARAG